MHRISQKVAVEVCRAWFEGLAGPGRQMRDDFSNGPGKAGKWELIFPTGLARPTKEKWVPARADLYNDLSLLVNLNQLVLLLFSMWYISIHSLKLEKRNFSERINPLRL